MVTPHSEHSNLAQELGVPALFLKREDFHPYGSHKGRSIPFMIDEKVSRDATHFALSSSGNAALAAIRHIQKLNSTEGRSLSLSVIVGKHINSAKKAWLLSEISSPLITLTETERPLQTLLNLIRGTKIESLRQSTDDTALSGYKALADELLAIPGLSDVFIASSSGTAAQALAERFIELKQPVAVHIVQTTEVAPIAGDFDAIGATLPRETSLADAIVDRVAHRRESLENVLRNIHGTGWIASNTVIQSAQKMLSEKASVETTANGALALAGLIAARARNTPFTGAVACIITGK